MLEFDLLIEPILFLSASLFFKFSYYISYSLSTSFMASSCFRLCSSNAFSLSASEFSKIFSLLNTVNFIAS